MGQEGKSLYTQFKEFEIMYHVATRMNPEQQRRLIGNDIAIILFVEEGQFDPRGLSSFGSVSQVFACVQPKTEAGTTLYQLVFVRSPTLEITPR